MAKLTVNTSAVNESVKATRWLRTDIKLGGEWLQVGFLALDGDYSDKTAKRIVDSFGLNAENPTKVNKDETIRFSLKLAESDTKLDVSDF